MLLGPGDDWAPTRPGVGIGRQEGLKNLWVITRVGSSPTPATIFRYLLICMVDT